ncbi:MAG: thioesterase family protein [Acidimicrobiales bacterium]
MTDTEGVVSTTRFADLLDLAKVDDDTWLGFSLPYPWGRIYGGQVMAQALWAAWETIDVDVLPHSLHAYFILPGDLSEPVRYEVDRLRDGRSFVTRRVVARQSDGAILNLSASFHVDEGGTEIQGATMPTDVDPPDAVESSSWLPVLDRRSVDDPLASANERSWFKVEGEMPEDPCAHACAHVFLSDSLPTRAVLGLQPAWNPARPLDHPYVAASLDHSMWFHRPQRGDAWTLHDVEAETFVSARGLTTGRLYSRDGLLVASSAQQVLVRTRRAPTPEGAAGEGSGGNRLHQGSPRTRG